jgi:hypothetical protein
MKWLPFLACYLIPRDRGFFFLFSLSFSSLDASVFGCFQPCWFFQMPLPSFCFVGALYVAWVLFYVGLFSVRTFLFFSPEGSKPHNSCAFEENPGNGDVNKMWQSPSHQYPLRSLLSLAQVG